MDDSGKAADPTVTVAPQAPTLANGMEDCTKHVDHMATETPEAPITVKHKIRSDLEKYIPKPYLGRALVCPDIEHPKGTPPLKNPDLTVLQRHVSFFDHDNDGIIYPWDITRGLISLGFPWIFASLAGIVVGLVFGYPTTPNWLPSPLLPTYIDNIHKGIHGSDTGAYDNEGRFVPAQFENIFSKYARTVPDKLTLWELWKMTDDYGDMYDFIGRGANKLEWLFLYYIAYDENGLLSKEDIRSSFDGTLFWRVASERRERERQRSQ